MNWRMCAKLIPVEYEKSIGDSLTRAKDEGLKAAAACAREARKYSVKVLKII